MSDNKRLEYFDALKGVAIILVVYYHIHMYYLSSNSIMNEICALVHMPIFFFISGYFSYSLYYDIEKFSKNMKNRLFKQLYPTIIVGALYTLALIVLFPEMGTKETILHSIYDPAKRGYWFTLSLVEVFVVFALMLLIFNSRKMSVKLQGIVLMTLFLLSSILAVVGFKSIDTYPGVVRKFICVFSLGKTFELLPYFLLGAISRIFQDRLEGIMNNRLICLGNIMMSIICINIDGTLAYFLSRCLALIGIISFFTIHQSFFSSETKMGRYLIKLGKNTLPIYIFHFFVFLILTKWVSDLIEPLHGFTTNILVEIAVFGILSIGIIELVLFSDRLLKKASWAHKLIYSY